MKCLMLIMALLISTVPLYGTHAQDAVDWVDCPFDVPQGPNIDCGYLTVPENRRTENTRTIQLLFAIIRSQNPQPDPIIYLEGGPGGSPLAAPADWINSPLLAQRDLILLDQRGTGYSQPSLDCQEEGLELQDENPEQLCYERLQSQGIDLSAYNTYENAEDIEALRRALGYDQVNLYGISYGTRLALNVMRQHPEGIRSVIIDGVFPPQVNSEEDDPVNFYTALSALFEDCANDTTCSAAYPNLEAEFYAAVEALEDNPMPAVDPETGEEYDLYGIDTLNILYQQLYVTDIIPALPAAMDALIAGDVDYFLELATYGAMTEEEEVLDPSQMTLEDAIIEAEFLLEDLAGEPALVDELLELAANEDFDGLMAVFNREFEPDPDYFEKIAEALIAVESGALDEDPVNDGDSLGMYNSVVCNDEIPFNDVDRTFEKAEAADIPEIVQLAMIEESLEATCDFWDSGLADAVENEPVQSDLPVLILSGEYDPTTPPAWGEEAAQYLPNSTHYVIPYAGHGVSAEPGCALDIVQGFLTNPSTPPSGTCINTIQVDFYVP